MNRKMDTLKEEEEESALNLMTPAGQSVQDELESFREEWTRELKADCGANPVAPAAAAGSNKKQLSKEEEEQKEKDIHTQAREYFLEGVRLEQNGNLYDAIRFYKKAVNLVPDIENETFVYNRKQNTATVNEADNQKEQDQTEEDENEDEMLNNLIDKFSQMRMGRQLIIQPMITTSGVHIGCLPTEVLLYILKWVVSQDLDLRSLEAVSGVCRALYVLARDREIWRQVCVRVWGASVLVGSDLPWREYFLHKPRVLYAGCYIAKTTYMREGERGFQDYREQNNYRGWHLVEYYRFIRLFPGGRMVMIISSDEPALIAKAMNSRHSCSVQSAMFGEYRVIDNLVVCVLHKQSPTNKKIQQASKFRRKRRDSMVYHDVPDSDYLIELTIKGTKNRVLHWKSYVVVDKYRDGRQTTNPIALSDSTFPRLIYSGVRSYHFESSSPL